MRDPAGGAQAPAPTPRVTLGVWELAWPTMVTFFLQTLVGFVDLWIVSALGSEAVAAAGMGHQVHFAMFAAQAAVTTGTVALVARSTGAGDAAEADRILRLSAAMGMALGAVLLALAPFTEAIMRAFGVEAAVVAGAGSYLRILLLFNVPFFFTVAVFMGIRGAGDVRTPLLVGAGTNVVNVVASWSLVYGRLGLPALGTDGAALGTGVAVSAAALVYAVLWARDLLVVPRRGWLGELGGGRARRILRIGVPTALEQGAFSLGLLLFLGLVARFGTEPVSAYLIGVRILAFSFVPGIGYSTAAGTLVGQHLGAEDPDAAARAGWRATAGAMAVMGGVGLAIIVLSQPIAQVFGAAGPRTVDLTVTFIYILGAAQPLMAVEFALGGALRGAGDTRFPLVSILTGLFAVRLSGAWLLAHVLDASVVAVWSCLLADYAVKAALLAGRFAAGTWKRVAV